MQILDLFKKLVSAKSTPEQEVILTDEYSTVLEFNGLVRKLLDQDRYVARSDYKIFQRYSSLYIFFYNLEQSGMLGDYVEKNHLDQHEIDFFRTFYNEIKDQREESSIVKNHNEEFISRHLSSEQDYLDNILKECDPHILLDEEQRRVVLSDEDYTLVIAGAGAGKTTTVAAKVRYLVEKKNVAPEKILVISFTNKAVNELRERINQNLQLPCRVTTFHSVGYTLMNQAVPEKRRIVDNGYLFNTIKEYLLQHVLSDSDMVNKLILFFGSYFTAPYEGNDLSEYFNFVSNSDCSTMKSNLHEYAKEIVDRKTSEAKTLNNEVLRSIEEVRIANFLYLNQLEYEYEPFYKYNILNSNKPYTPDFIIRQGDKEVYLEHFGITEDGKNNRYSAEELTKYKKRIEDKILLHKKHGTTLIYTYSRYSDGRDLLEHLQEQLAAVGFSLEPRSSDEVYRKLVNEEEGKYIIKLVALITNFINNFKTQGYGEEQFSEFLHKSRNVRTKLFLEICNVCYLEYQKTLKENQCIDFQDMINESAELIRQKQISEESVDVEYIIVDEYQDISRQRYNLVSEMSKLCHAKIVAVGDDWQSIYAFSGSDITLFTLFRDSVGYAQELKITRTYRNAQEIIDIAGNFVQKNPCQIHKSLISNKRISNPVIIFPYDKENRKGKSNSGDTQVKYIGDAVNMAIGEILKYNEAEGKLGTASILLIGRYGFDARNLCYSEAFSYDEKRGLVYSNVYRTKVKLTFLTAHSSKGLSADNVIIINSKDDIYGFPSKIEDDPVLKLVTSDDQSCEYAEERRLFYVALTRTRNRVFIVTPTKRPSNFIKELLLESKMYPNVILKGELKSGLEIRSSCKNLCPICGYPLQLRWNKNYGLKLYMCTNDQEICGFMTNDLRGGKLSIHKCDMCRDGYLVVKPGKKDYILGCTNFRKDKTGCNRILSPEYYRNWLDTSFGKEVDYSDKPAFLKKVEPSKPKPISVLKPSNERKTGEEDFDGKKQRKSSVHTIQQVKQVVEYEDFKVLKTADGELLTDIRLLKKLRQLRYTEAMKHNVKPYMIMDNEQLAYMATDKPETRDEYLKIKGLGPIRYEKYGMVFIEFIKKYCAAGK